MRARRLRLLTPVGGDYRYRNYRLKLEPIDDLGEVVWREQLIRIHSEQDDEEVVSTAWHEAVHVAAPGLSEEAVLAVEWNIRQVDGAIRRMLGMED